MMLPWREARVVGVFGDYVGEALKGLREDAQGCGVRTITVMDTGRLEAGRFVYLQRRIAHAVDGRVLLDLRFAKPSRLRAMLKVADFGVAAFEGDQQFCLIAEGDVAIPIALPSEGAQQ